MIRDKWIYQKRQVATPWAVYLVANDDRITKRTKDVAYTVYSEEIGNEYDALNAIDVVPNMALIELEMTISRFTEFDDADHEQLASELESFIR
jgi:hypothetical protein